VNNYAVTVSISANKNNVCQGTVVRFTAVGANFGEDPHYHFIKNGSYIGSPTSQNWYEYVPLDNDQISVAVYSSLPCATPDPAFAISAVIMNIYPSGTLTLTITSNLDYLSNVYGSSYFHISYDFSIIASHNGTNCISSFYFYYTIFYTDGTEMLSPPSHSPAPGDPYKYYANFTIPSYILGVNSNNMPVSHISAYCYAESNTNGYCLTGQSSTITLYKTASEYYSNYDTGSNIYPIGCADESGANGQCWTLLGEYSENGSGHRKLPSYQNKYIWIYFDIVPTDVDPVWCWNGFYTVVSRVNFLSRYFLQNGLAGDIFWESAVYCTGTNHLCDVGGNPYKYHPFRESSDVNWGQGLFIQDHWGMFVAVHYGCPGCWWATSDSIGVQGQIKIYSSIYSLGYDVQLGKSYQGGKIFYIDNTGNHGLVVKSGDWATTAWGCYGTWITGTYSDIGTGSANTDKIDSVCLNSAAHVAKTYTSDGYTDWYLPSSDELLKIIAIRNLAGIKEGYAWSSTEYDDNYANIVNISNGGVTMQGAKNELHNILYVRSF
jgi:hypothetical protein